MKKNILSQKDLVFSIYELAKTRFILEESNHNQLNLAVGKYLVLKTLYFNNSYSTSYVAVTLSTEMGNIEFTATSFSFAVSIPGSNIYDFDLSSLLKRTINALKKLPIVKAKIVKDEKTRKRMFVVGDKSYQVLEEITK